MNDHTWSMTHALHHTIKKWMILPDLWHMLYIRPLRNEWSYLIYDTWSTTYHQEMNDHTWSMTHDLQQTTKKWMILPDLWHMIYIIPPRNEWSYLIYGTWSTTDHQEMNDHTWSMTHDLHHTTKKWMIIPDLWHMIYNRPPRNECSYLIYDTWSTTDHQEMNDHYLIYDTWSTTDHQEMNDHTWSMAHDLQQTTKKWMLLPDLRHMIYNRPPRNECSYLIYDTWSTTDH